MVTHAKSTMPRSASMTQVMTVIAATPCAAA